MKKPNTLKAIFGGAILLFVASSHAASTWDFGTSCAVTNGSGSNPIGASGCTATSGSMTANATGWSTTASGATTFAAATMYNWAGGGLGVNTGNELSPQHATDNQGTTDLVSLKFSQNGISQKVVLDTLTLGYAKEQIYPGATSYNSYADVSVLAYTRTTGMPPSDVSGLTTAQLIANGWELVSHYLDKSGSFAINSGNISSSWWLVSAYNASYGAPTGETKSDYFKFLSASSSYVPPTPGVPEPGALSLIGLALIGMIGASRRRKIA